MNTVPSPSLRPPPPWFPMLPPDLPVSSAFWGTSNVREWLTELQNTLTLAKAMQKELEMLSRLQDPVGSTVDADCKSCETSVTGFYKLLEDRRIGFSSQESLSVEAANSVICKLRAQLEPFRVVTDERSPWEEKTAAARLTSKMHKSKRNKLWRKRKRRRIAEMQSKEREQFDKLDQEADEWRAREIAKDIAKRKLEEMRVIAKVKAEQERRALESELELILVVEKLQELRSIRIQKLKRQGHFLPNEDDKFLERVRVAVEEEERQAVAAADMAAAKDAIATAEESRKIIQGGLESEEMSTENVHNGRIEDLSIEDETRNVSSAVHAKKPQMKGIERRGYAWANESVANLPPEFYHYYHGSNTDMGTLIEVRNQWDAYIRPGGSRIPSHWVQPPPPADETWASYLVRSK